MKQSNSLSSKDENMSSENGAAGLTQDQLLFTEKHLRQSANKYRSL